MIPVCKCEISLHFGFQLTAWLPLSLAIDKKSRGQLIETTVQELWVSDGREVKLISLWTLHILPKHSGNYLCPAWCQPDTASTWQRNAVTKRIGGQVGTPSSMTSGCQSLVCCNQLLNDHRLGVIGISTKYNMFAIWQCQILKHQCQWKWYLAMLGSLSGKKKDGSLCVT